MITLSAGRRMLEYIAGTSFLTGGCRYTDLYLEHVYNTRDLNHSEAAQIQLPAEYENTLCGGHSQKHNETNLMISAARR